MSDPENTYRDGVATQRCVVCGAAQRRRDDAPMVSVLLSDVEEVAQAFDLFRAYDRDGSIALLIRRFEQAAGRTVRQMQASAPAEAIPAHVKTDRGGLVIP